MTLKPPKSLFFSRFPVERFTKRNENNRHSVLPANHKCSSVSHFLAPISIPEPSLRLSSGAENLAPLFALYFFIPDPPMTGTHSQADKQHSPLST